jgi:hypothetical protein
MRTNTTEGVRRRWSFGRSRRLGAEQDPLGAHRDRLGSRGGRTLGHAGQARRGGLGSGLGSRPCALRSLVASHHAGQAAAPWPLLRARRERAGHAPRRLRATRWPRRPRTTPAAHCAGPLGRTAGGAKLAAPGRRAGAAPKPRPSRGRALTPEPRPRRGRAPALGRARAGAAPRPPASGRRGRHVRQSRGEGQGEGGRGRAASRERERDVRGIGEGEKEVGERGWG